MSIIADHLTNSDILQVVGARLRASRLERNLPVNLLAEIAGVNRKTILDLESGCDVRMSSFVKVLRGMNMLGTLDGAFPDTLPGGMTFSSKGTVRKNAYRPRTK